MKAVLLALVAASTLSACVAVPAYGPPGVYVAPTVVVPFGGYHRGHRYR